MIQAIPRECANVNSRYTAISRMSAKIVKNLKYHVSKQDKFSFIRDHFTTMISDKFMSCNSY